MRRVGLLAIAAFLAIGVVSRAWFARTVPVRPPAPDAAAEGHASGDKDRQPTLYCEFTNFADRTPQVGFYFLIEGTRTPPTYALIFQREKDGAQADFGGPDAPRPE